MGASPWPPATEDDLRNAAASGALEEGHLVDVKRALPPGDKANKELAADLASFAVDGGRLIFGVAEGNGVALIPVRLAGLAERIELVARSRVDEPLYVEFTTIRSSSDPDLGYLVVSIPMSPRAPHMAGHSYWGRGAKTKYPLSDAEVERLLMQRSRWATETRKLLSDWGARDPIGPPDQRLAHLHVVAVPVPRRDAMVLEMFTGAWQSKLRELVHGASCPGDRVAPDLEDALGYYARTPRGWACSSAEVSVQGRAQPQYEQRFVELEVTEDGLMQLITCRAADLVEPGKMVVLETACLRLTYRMVTLAAIVSAEVPFLGSWDFAVGITGLKGAISFLRPHVGLIFDHPVYTEAEFHASTRASRQEIEAKPGAVVERLLGRLMRAIGIDRAPPLQELLGR